MAAINISVGGDTRKLERDIQRSVNKNYNINLKTKGEQPLGRITGKVNEFTKSLDASNARVIAFGASAGLIFGLQRAFEALVSSTINVQKSLAEINTVLNVSTTELNNFGSSLFNIAKNTGQSFDEVAKAATEFSRQGLGVEETLKRTSNALVLARLSGLDTVKSVEALTAAVNSFANEAVTASEIVNKFATVDAAFAVSSGDLAEAISRVGSSAAQSGVSLNELIAIVTSAQQTTARGGAVIGNSFKTIFTRLQRQEVIDLLGNLGIGTTDSEGKIKSTIQLLQDLAGVYDTLGQTQQSAVAEKVGGVFQINILKSALADLGKEYSVYSNALQIAGTATDQAVRRNEELNKTYAAQLNALQQNATQLASNVGGKVLGPSFDRLVGGANALLGGINESDGQGVGAALANGILDGLGKVLAGPGLALIGGVLIKLIKDFTIFASGSIKELLGLNNATKQQAELQKSVNQILQQNPNLLKLMAQGTAGVTAASKILLENLRAQTIELQKQNTLSAQVAKTFYASGARIVGGVPTIAPTKGKAFGYIPNFANMSTGGVSPQDKKSEIMGALDGGYPPGDIVRVNGNMIANTAETFKQYPGADKLAIQPPEDSKAGKKYKKDFKRKIGIDPYNDSKAFGYIPNFAKINKTKEPKVDKKLVQKEIDKLMSQVGYLIPAVSDKGILENSEPISAKSYDGYKFLGLTAKAPNVPKAANKTDSLEQKVENSVVKSASQYTSELKPLGLIASESKIRRNFKIFPGASGALKGAVGSAFEVGIASALDYEAANRDRRFGDFDVRDGAGLSKVQQLFDIGGISLADFKASTSREAVESFYAKIIKEASAKVKGLQFTKQDEIQQSNKLANAKVRERIRSLYGDEAVNKYFTKEGYPKKNLVNYSPTGDYEKSATAQIERMISKEKDRIQPRIYSPKKGKASGFIPNFAALQDAISREKSAGIPGSKIYLATDKRLAAAGYNPLGLGVFNTRDEPTASARSSAVKSRGYAGGYIPNFAEDGNQQSLGSTIGAVTFQLAGLATMLALNKNSYANSIQELIKVNKQASSAQRNELAKKIKEQKNTAREAGVSTSAVNQSIQRQYGKEISSLKGASIGQKASTALGAGGGAMAITFLAPMITEAIVNGMNKGEKTTKSDRQASSIVSGIGQTASFAGTGFMLGGPWGAAIGAAIGAIMTLVDWINQTNTDLPELSAAAQQSSEKLNKFNDASQKVLTSFEQISQLRQSGQAEKAGTLEADLLNKVKTDFSGNQELINKASIAIINKDFKSLQDAIAENTKALTDSNAQKERDLAVQKDLEKLRDQGFQNKEGKEAAKSLADKFINNIDTSNGVVGTENIDTLISQAKALPKDNAKTAGQAALAAGPYGATGASQGANQLLAQMDNATFMKNINASELPDAVKKVVQKLLDQGGSLGDAAAFLEEYKKNVESSNNTYLAIIRNTEKGNKAIEIIYKALDNVGKNFNKLANISNQSIVLQTALKNAQAQALAGYKVAALGESAETAKAFGAKSQGQGFEIQGGLLKAQSDFDKNIQDSLGDVTTTIGQVFNQALTAGFSNIRSFNPEETNAEQRAKNQLQEAGRLAESLMPETLIKDINSLIGASKFSEQGFDTEGIISAIESNQDFLKLSTDQQKEATDKVRTELNKANQTLQSSKTTLEQQKAILANQKLNEIMREFAAAIQNAFGGVSKFLEGKYGDKTQADTMYDILGERQSYTQAVQRTGGYMEPQTTVEMGRTAGQYTDLLEGMVGRKGIFGEGDKLVQQEIAGYSTYIEDIFRQAFTDAQMSGDTGAQEGIQKAYTELARQAGVTTTPENFTGMPKEVFDAIAKMAVTQRRETANVEEGIKKSALQSLSQLPGGEELAKIAAQGGENITSDTIFIKQNQTQIDLLAAIEAAIKNADYESAFSGRGYDLTGPKGIMEGVFNQNDFKPSAGLMPGENASNFDLNGNVRGPSMLNNEPMTFDLGTSGLPAFQPATPIKLPTVETSIPTPETLKTVNTTPVSPTAGTTASNAMTSVNVTTPVTVNATTNTEGKTDNIDWEKIGPAVQTLVDQNMPQILASLGAKVDRTESVVNNMLSNPQFASFRPPPSQTASQGVKPA